jgi:hypothetical protein
VDNTKDAMTVALRILSVKITEGKTGSRSVLHSYRMPSTNDKKPVMMIAKIIGEVPVVIVELEEVHRKSEQNFLTAILRRKTKSKYQ